MCRTEITIESEQVLIVRRHSVTRAWCRECQAEVEMIGVEEATGETLRGTGRDSGEARHWHVSQGADGTALICLGSVSGRGPQQGKTEGKSRKGELL